MELSNEKERTARRDTFFSVAVSDSGMRNQSTLGSVSFPARQSMTPLRRLSNTVSSLL